jgi:hypothetical protein
MSRGRTLTSLEFVTQDGLRLELDEKGWRLLHARQLGEAQLEKARAFVEQVEACIPPANEDGSPHDLFQIGDHAAKVLRLRNTQRRFRQKR